MGEQYEVVWTNIAQKQMQQLFAYIGRDSMQNASKVAGYNRICTESNL